MPRASEYTPELGEAIANLLAEGLSMRVIAEMEEMPGRSTMLRWLQRDDIDFGAKCTRARRVQGELAVDEHKEVIDETRAGKLAPDVARAVLSGLEWRAKKLEPKKYGDSTQLRHADADGNKLSFQGILNELDGGTASLPGAKEQAE